jgi:hypothetical protein
MTMNLSDLLPLMEDFHVDFGMNFINRLPSSEKLRDTPRAFILRGMVQFCTLKVADLLGIVQTAGT